jgi:2-oxoglutarate dehydrogenase complex dehydrogenase (E1) component-like enzyme
LSHDTLVNLGQQKDSAKLSDVIAQLEKSYCSKIGVQFAQVEV